MTSSIRRLWQRLDGRVHPDDRPIFERHQHTFNLDYPPPAYIGDVDHAPVVVLMENGGYDPNLTPTEFRRPEDIIEYIDYLRGDRLQFPVSLSPYYTASSLGSWLAEGQVVIVNVVAYRSPKLSKEPMNRRLANLLPSVAAHRQWLRTELLQAAREGKRLVVAHRYRMWRLAKYEQLPNVRFSTNSASPHLSADMLATIRRWLSERSAD